MMIQKLYENKDPDGAHMHPDPFFEQYKASASLDPKTDHGYPYLKFYEKICGVITFWLLDQNYFRSVTKNWKFSYQWLLTTIEILFDQWCKAGH